MKKRDKVQRGIGAFYTCPICHGSGAVTQAVQERYTSPQQPAAPSGTRNFRAILAEREAQSPGITAKVEERTAALVTAPQQPAGVDELIERLIDMADGFGDGPVVVHDHDIEGLCALLREAAAALAAQQQGGRDHD